MEWGESSDGEGELEEVLTVEESVSMVLKKFEDVFTWLDQLPPKRSIEHHIHLKQGTEPVNVRSYRYVFQQKAEVKKLVDDEMLASGIIQPSSNPYSSPVMLVRKKDES